LLIGDELADEFSFDELELGGERSVTETDLVNWNVFSPLIQAIELGAQRAGIVDRDLSTNRNSMTSTFSGPNQEPASFADADAPADCCAGGSPPRAAAAITINKVDALKTK
jgi:hypothetical protein